MSDHAEHIVPVRIYLAIFTALIVGTGLTVWVAFQNFGIFNNFLALGIAVAKATLVVLYFMHVRYSSRLTWMVIVAAIFWLLILFAFTLSDYDTRGMLPYPGK